MAPSMHSSIVTDNATPALLPQMRPRAAHTAASASLPAASLCPSRPATRRWSRAFRPLRLLPSPSERYQATPRAAPAPRLLARSGTSPASRGSAAVTGATTENGGGDSGSDSVVAVQRAGQQESSQQAPAEGGVRRGRTTGKGVLLRLVRGRQQSMFMPAYARQPPPQQQQQRQEQQDQNQEQELGQGQQDGQRPSQPRGPGGAGGAGSASGPLGGKRLGDSPGPGEAGSGAVSEAGPVIAQVGAASRQQSSRQQSSRQQQQEPQRQEPRRRRPEPRSSDDEGPPRRGALPPPPSSPPPRSPPSTPPSSQGGATSAGAPALHDPSDDTQAAGGFPSRRGRGGGGGDPPRPPRRSPALVTAPGDSSTEPWEPPVVAGRRTIEVRPEAADPGDHLRLASAGGARDGGTASTAGAEADLADRLARVLSFVERELLGAPQAAAAAAAVAAVEPDAPLPGPIPPPPSRQPLELFAEPPLTGRILARAGAAEAPARQVTSPPSPEDWRLLGGAAPVRAPSPADGATGAAASGEAATSADADAFFRRRQEDLRPYRSYLRSVVLRSGPGGIGVYGAHGGSSGGEGGRRQRRNSRTGREGNEEGAGLVQAPAGPLDPGLRAALLEEVTTAGDWLQLRDLLEVVGAGAAGGLRDPRVVAAAFKQAAGLLGGHSSANTQEEQASDATTASGPAGRAPSSGPEYDNMYGFGPTEAEAFRAFCAQLAAAGASVLSPNRRPGGTAGGHARGRGGRGGNVAGGGFGGSGGGGNDAECSGHEVAQIAYGMGMLQVLSRTLYDAVLQVSGEQLAAAAASRSAAAAATAAAAAALRRGLHLGGSGGGAAAAHSGSSAVQAPARVRRERPSAATAVAAAALKAEAASAVAEAADWPMSDIVSLAWGVATSYGGSTTTRTGAGVKMSTAQHDTGKQAPDSGWSQKKRQKKQEAADDDDDEEEAEAMDVLPLARPSDPWFISLCDASYDGLAEATPTQLWGLVWSFARLAHVPKEDWMAVFLERVRASLGAFDPEGVSRLLWSLAALDYVPDRLWLRAVMGQVVNQLPSLTPAQLVSVFCSLARLGYAPRPEVGARLHSAAARLMPLMGGEQLAALGLAAASFERWRPGGPFMRSLARAARPHAASLTATQAARLLWCWARCDPPGVPRQQQQQQQQERREEGRGWRGRRQGGQGPGAGAGEGAGAGAGSSPSLPLELLRGLRDRVLTGMSSGRVDGSDLSMAIWALAVLRALPGDAWLAAWWRAVADPRVTPSFTATAVGQSLWAAAQLQTLRGGGFRRQQPRRGALPSEGAGAGGVRLTDGEGTRLEAAGPGSSSRLHGWESGTDPRVGGVPVEVVEAGMRALLARMSALLRSAATADLSTAIAALADLQYRPSDAWLTLFCGEARRRLGAETAANEDHGLIAYGLAVLGWPLSELWVKELAAEGYRRMGGMSGEALGLLLWGLAQYGWSTDSRRFWKTVFGETGAKWDSCSARSVVLLYCAVADMLPPDMEPPLQWQRQLAKALRLRIPRPPTAALIPAALRAAAGGCLGPSPLRLKGSAAAAAATAGGLFVTPGPSTAFSLSEGFDRDHGGAASGVRQYGRGRSALDESLEATAASRLEGGGSHGRIGDAREEEEEGGWAEEGEDQEEEGEEGGEEEGEEGEAADGWGGDPDVWEMEEEEEDDEGWEEEEGGGGADPGSPAQRRWLSGGGPASARVPRRRDSGGPSGPRPLRLSPLSPYIFDPEASWALQREMYGGGDGYGNSIPAGALSNSQPPPLEPFGLLRYTDLPFDIPYDTTSAASATAASSDPPPFLLPLPMEVTDPRIHSALAAATAADRVWWAHDVTDELRWLWGFPGVLRGLPPWVRQPSLRRLRGMMAERRR